MVQDKKQGRWWLGVLIPLMLLFLGFLSGIWGWWLGEHWGYFNSRHLGLLAQRFWQWKVSIHPINRPTDDVVDYFANFYLYFGPMSSLLLMPVVLVWKSAKSQIILGLLSMVVSLVSGYKIAEKLGYKEVDRWWWLVFVGFSTPMLGVSAFNISAYQVQALGFALVLLSLWEYYGKRRYWLVGVLVAMAGMTRMSLYLMVFFYGMEWLRSVLKVRKVPLNWFDKLTASRFRISQKVWQVSLIKPMVWMMIPVTASVLVLGLYNYRRFGSFTETGYAFNVTLENYPMVANIAHGFMSLKHVPGNLYVMLLKAPEPVFKGGGGFVLKYPYIKADPWGFSLLIGSPLLLVLFHRLNWKKEWSLLLSILVMALPVLLYFGIGYSQFGYRYGLDFLPLVIVLLMKHLKGRLGWGGRLLIGWGVVFNCVYLLSMVGAYPLLNIYEVDGRLIGGWW